MRPDDQLWLTGAPGKALGWVDFLHEAPPDADPHPPLRNGLNPARARQRLWPQCSQCLLLRSKVEMSFGVGCCAKGPQVQAPGKEEVTETRPVR